MDYSQASNRFNFDKFLEQLRELDLLDIIKTLYSESDLAENIKISSKAEYKRDIEYLQSNYISKLKALSFLLGQGIKPAGIDKDTLAKFKPILVELIRKKQLNETILKLIE